MSSLDRILPFLRPIEDLLLDPTITEVMVNEGGRRVFVERDGVIELVPDRALEARNLTVAIKNIARACGDEISDMQPLLDARLEGGVHRRASPRLSAISGIRRFVVYLQQLKAIQEDRSMNSLITDTYPTFRLYQALRGQRVALAGASATTCCQCTPSSVLHTSL